MKQIRSWICPLSETHMADYLAKYDSYQDVHRQKALARVTNFHTAIDIGGHIGTWGRDLSNLFEVLHVFEPIDDFTFCYQKNVIDLPHKADVIMHDIVLGDTIDMVSMEVDPNNTGHSHVSPSSKQWNYQMSPLDAFGIENVGYIKIDVEGYEEFVCRGGEGTILRWKPIISIEQKPHGFYTNTTQYAARDFLESIGMVILDRQSDDWILGWKDS